MEKFVTIQPTYIRQFVQKMLIPWPNVTNQIINNHVQLGKYSLLQRIGYIFQNQIHLKELGIFFQRIEIGEMFLSDKNFQQFIVDSTSLEDEESNDEEEIEI